MMSQAQQVLKQKGFYTGNVDGISGPKTKMAIRRFQQADNLNQSGTLDQATLSSLGLSGSNNTGEAARSDQSQSNSNGNNASDENSSSNISSDRIREVQQKLADNGYYKGNVDGMMNQATRAGIRQFQKDNNLPVTGRMNRETARSMGLSKSQGNFENNNSQTPLEQLGKGVAEGAKTP